ACRRPISPSDNCQNWYRRRFSWPAAVLTRTTEQQPRPILSTGTGLAPGFAKPIRSEFVAQAGADGIDVGVDHGREADVFPLRAQKQTADQIDVDAETSGIAINQVAVLGLVCG